MQKTAKKKHWELVLDLLFLLVPIILTSYLLFFPGLITGDDSFFHISLIIDIEYGYKQGFWGLSPTHIIEGALGYNPYLFYGPLPHHLAAFILYLTEGLGADATIAYKVVCFLSSHIGALYMYLLGKKMTHSRLASLLSATFYVCFPYRILTLYHREAFAEFFAMGFIPMFFYGLYRIVHDERFFVSPYVSVVVAMSVLVLSHPSSALLSATYGVLYLLFCLPKFLKAFRRRHAFPAGLISLALIVGLLYFYLVPQITLIREGKYVVYHDEQMWTSIDQVKDTAGQNTINFSGIICQSWIESWASNGWWKGSKDYFSLWISAFFGLGGILLMCLFHLLYTLVAKEKRNLVVTYVVDACLLFVPVFFSYRLEVLLGSLVFYLLFFLITFPKDKEVDNETKNTKIYKTSEFYFYPIAIAAIVITLFVPQVWDKIPSIYRKMQFVWRQWTLVAFLGTMFVLFLYSYLPFKEGKTNKMRKGTLVTSSLLIALSLSLSQGLTEKRSDLIANNYQPQIHDVDESYDSRVSFMGTANEYMPYVFYDENYYSSYPNSLYTPIRYIVFRSNGDTIDSLDEYNSDIISPRFLEGSGEAKATEMKTPEMILALSSTEEDSLLQLPTFYYPGYEAVVLEENGKETSEKYEGVEVDGLLAFRLEKEGDYSLKVKYVGPKAYRTGKILFPIAFVLLIAFGVLGTFVSRKEDPYRLLTKEL